MVFHASVEGASEYFRAFCANTSLFPNARGWGGARALLRSPVRHACACGLVLSLKEFIAYSSSFIRTTNHGTFYTLAMLAISHCDVASGLIAQKAICCVLAQTISAAPKTNLSYPRWVDYPTKLIC